MSAPATAPDFIIIGAMRAGTTALADNLSHHHAIGMSRLKETDFFIEEKNYGRGRDWYQSLFPGGKQILGEASPNYTKNDVFQGVPRRIHSFRPDVKLVYIVRDPVERFWSQYKHTYLMRGGVPEPDDLLGHHEGGHILAASMYFTQLNAYLEYFSRDQIQIIDFDAYTKDAPPVLSKLYAFIGVDDFDPAGRCAGPANSSRSLAQTPAWALVLSQHPAITNLRASSPPAMRRLVKKMASRMKGAPRTIPSISRGARLRVSEALARDTENFRALTGVPFAHWSI